MQHLVIGNGEIGKSLAKVFDDCSLLGRVDMAYPHPNDLQILHICFPYSEEFEREVLRYKELYTPNFTVIHSTVPIGTCTKLKAIHSPVIGIHPELQQSLTIFIKFLAGPDADKVAQSFRRAGMKVYLFDKPETTEYLKLRCTEKYGLDIEFAKDIKRGCVDYGIPFEAYTLWTQNYNLGYTKLGHEEFVRPNLIPMMGTTGGHCILPNAKMLDTKFTKLINEAND